MKRLAEQWDSFCEAVMPEDAPPVQRQEMRRAFYAGAGGMFDLVCRVIPEAVNEEQGEAMLTELEKELRGYLEDLKAGKV
jgi:hypothetical protein